MITPEYIFGSDPQPVLAGLDKWDQRFIDLAREVSTWSKDPQERVGCVVTSSDRRRVTVGYNGLPRGLEDTEDRLSVRDLRNRLSVHAELNAILNARTDLTGWILYTTKAPCIGCATALVQAGLIRVVCPEPRSESRWYPEQRQAERIILEAGVGLTNYRDDSTESSNTGDI